AVKSARSREAWSSAKADEDATEDLEVFDFGGVAPLGPPAVAGLALDPLQVAGDRARTQVCERQRCRHDHGAMGGGRTHDTSRQGSARSRAPGATRRGKRRINPRSWGGSSTRGPSPLLPSSA